MPQGRAGLLPADDDAEPQPEPPPLNSLGPPALRLSFGQRTPKAGALAPEQAEFPPCSGRLLPGFAAAVDRAALFEYFTFQNIFTDRTLLESVELLPPGHYATLDLAEDTPELRRTQYWDFDFREPERPAEPEAEPAAVPSEAKRPDDDPELTTFARLSGCSDYLDVQATEIEVSDEIARQRRVHDLPVMTIVRARRQRELAERLAGAGVPASRVIAAGPGKCQTGISQRSYRRGHG